MSGGNYGEANASPFAAIMAVVSLGFIALIGAGGFVFGDFNGSERARENYGKQSPWGYQCLLYEDRQFADVGWFIFAGSGEIRTKRICVHAEMKR